MEKLIRFLKIDLKVQKILFVVTICSVIWPLFIPMLLCLLGGWQIVSAIVVWGNLKDKQRLKYLIFSFGCLMIMGVAIYFLDEIGDYFMVVLLIGFIIFPLGIATWYFVLTKNTLKTLEDNKGRFIDEDWNSEDILDSNEVLVNSKNILK